MLTDKWFPIHASILFLVLILALDISVHMLLHVFGTHEQQRIFICFETKLAWSIHYYLFLLSIVVFFKILRTSEVLCYCKVCSLKGIFSHLLSSPQETHLIMASYSIMWGKKQMQSGSFTSVKTLRVQWHQHCYKTNCKEPQLLYVVLGANTPESSLSTTGAIKRLLHLSGQSTLRLCEHSWTVSYSNRNYWGFSLINHPWLLTFIRRTNLGSSAGTRQALLSSPKLCS